MLRQQGLLSEAALFRSTALHEKRAPVGYRRFFLPMHPGGTGSTQFASPDAVGKSGFSIHQWHSYCYYLSSGLTSQTIQGN
ncbi:hypothetical protein FHW67_002950 [Herbaspirillum sp. Sphag1AN]|uniref:hypothetical protein n=1 Tax=unclassified Herbaspirillum TaxID=2624150 RepID=UPI001618C8C1|nr:MULTISPECIES: hypothetical protein [unclassified Herbaspirillum]MBB3213652.1 hypothetical protein [Herbaspirillum sp. Sphag1AN]MBB3246850.1 hypothetical protein [Herbaspirillum sp. Sphag64]